MADVYPLLVYLAGPQDDVSKETAQEWREMVAAHAPLGVAFFSPAHAYSNVNQANFPAVDQMNRKAIEVCHAMIANLSGEGRGFGTIREIEYAVANHTIVQVVGNVGHSLMTWDLTVVSSVTEAMDNILAKIDELRAQMRQHPLMRLIPPEERP